MPDAEGSGTANLEGTAVRPNSAGSRPRHGTKMPHRRRASPVHCPSGSDNYVEGNSNGKRGGVTDADRTSHQMEICQKSIASFPHIWAGSMAPTTRSFFIDTAMMSKPQDVPAVSDAVLNDI